MHDPPEILLMKNLNWPKIVEKVCVAILRDAAQEEISIAELNRFEIFPVGEYSEPENSIIAEKSGKCSIM
uniref:Uncharacterized protein n=1 Tax=Romanomermis culicivorax TaxID=13658 RepID=A0A915IWE8_ROMCU